MAYNYPDLTYDDLSGAYKEAKHQCSIISDKVSSYACQEPYNLRCYDYFHYAKNILDIDIYGYEFPKETAEIFGGSILVDPSGSAVIGYNSVSVPGRQHHSVLHELYHYFVDVPKRGPGERFNELLAQENYTYDEQLMEAQANFGAAFMHMPEVAMLAMIIEHKDLKQGFSRQFASSYGANFTRVRDYLVYSLHYYTGAANRLTNGYINDPQASKLYNIILNKASETPELLSDKLNSTVILNGDHSYLEDFEEGFDEHYDDDFSGNHDDFLD
jgi:Zn-dependent peptidase ImmA (M78 family)